LCRFCRRVQEVDQVPRGGWPAALGPGRVGVDHCRRSSEERAPVGQEQRPTGAGADQPRQQPGRAGLEMQPIGIAALGADPHPLVVQLQVLDVDRQRLAGPGGRLILRIWLKTGNVTPMSIAGDANQLTGTTCAMPESPKTRFTPRRPRLFGSGTNVGPDRAGGLGPEHQLAYERVKRPGPPPPNKAKMTVRAWCKAPRCAWTAEGRFGPVTAAFDKHSKGG
jgi:hypothetical protein